MRGPVASSPAAVARYILRREPWPRRRFTRLPEHVDGNAAARIPIAANSEPERSHFREQPLANANSAILMKARVVTECTKKQLQRFRLYNHFIRGIVNDEMREVRSEGRRVGKEWVRTCRSRG